MKNVLFCGVAAALLLSSCATQRSVQRVPTASAVESSTPLLSYGAALQAGGERSGVPTDYVASAEASSLIPVGTAPIEEAVTFTAKANNSSIAKQEKIAQKISQLQQKIAKVQANQKNGVVATKQLSLVQKVALNKVLRSMQKVKGNDDVKDFHDLDGRLKIGILLLGIALILALFGLGLIAGIAGLIALCFIVLGLMGMYY
jgi:hypothetical protein